MNRPNHVTWPRRALAAAITALSAVAAAQTAPHATKAEWVSYRSEADGLEIPTLAVRPQRSGDYPTVLYVHGRWGLVPEVVTQLHRLAERGIVVFAPDYYIARAVPTLAWFNDPDVGRDVQSAVPYVHKLANSGRDGRRRIGIVAQDHGGFHAIQASARFPEAVGGIVGYYPLTNDPQQPKARHIYAYMPEVDKVKAPVLFMMGKEDREMRRIAAKRVIERLQSPQHSATYVEFPGANRCYDWRVVQAQMADALARVESLNQLTRFLAQNIGGSGLRVLEADGWRTIAGVAP